MAKPKSRPKPIIRSLPGTSNYSAGGKIVKKRGKRGNKTK